MSQIAREARYQDLWNRWVAETGLEPAVADAVWRQATGSVEDYQDADWPPFPAMLCTLLELALLAAAADVDRERIDQILREHWPTLYETARRFQAANVDTLETIVAREGNIVAVDGVKAADTPTPTITLPPGRKPN